jgi:hypothetical protein
MASPSGTDPLGLRLGGLAPAAKDGDTNAPRGEPGRETRTQDPVSARHDGRLAGESLGRLGHYEVKDIG